MPLRSFFGRPSRRFRRFAFLLLVLVGFGFPTLGWFHHRARAEAPAASVEVHSGETPVVSAGLLASAVYRDHITTPLERLRSFGGVLFLVGLCWLMSRNRRAIDWRLVGIGLGMQVVLALFLLKVEAGRKLFDSANDAIVKLLDYSKEGSAFLFSSYVTGKVEGPMVNFAFQVLPSIVFFSSLMAVLYHVGAMQRIIRGITWAMQRTMRTSGAETLSTAANIFVGQTEAPLLVKPFVSTMTKSELLVIMAGGMANTAGGVLAAYVGMLYTFFPDIAGHLLVESILSAPAALVTAKMLWPEDGVPTTLGATKLEIPKVDSNAVEAAARGASEGLTLAFNVAAMLIAFIALVKMMDGGLEWFTTKAFHHPVTFQRIAGLIFVPFAWFMGVPSEDCGSVGDMLGQKIVLNEFVAYGTLTKMLALKQALISQRAVMITSYALSGFANFGSIAIQIGGIGAMAPERRSDIASLGILALIAGSFATFMTACFAGALVSI